VALKTQQMQGWATLPLLICADVEEGVGQRFSGATWFPPPMALAAWALRDGSAAIAAAEEMGAVTAQEARAIGLNWLLTPTVDVNNNPHNPVINVRAFGETPEQVSALITAYIRGAQTQGLLTTAKHFPGHGDTAIDSHLELPVLSHSLERLQAVELPPFRAAMTAGVDGVMSAHLLLTALDSTVPATLSPRVIHQLLRQELGFQGLVVTDALVMGAIADHYGPEEAAIRAVEAGADIVLMPADAAATIAALCAAVDSGRITQARIAESLERIWRAKQTLPAPLSRVSAVHLQTELAQPGAMATVAQICRGSLRVRSTNSTSWTAQRWSGPGRNLILSDTVLDSQFLGRRVPSVVLPQGQGFDLVQLVDGHTPVLDWYQQPSRDTLMQCFLRGHPLRGMESTLEQADRLLQWLIQTEQLRGLVVYGSPYVFEALAAIVPEPIPCVLSYGQMPMAQQIALEALFGMGSAARLRSALANGEGLFE
jgi:beta-glucosidase